MMKWAEISDQGEQKRFTALSQALTEFGIENEFQFLEATPETFDAVLKSAKRDFQQLRIGGSFCTQIVDKLDSFTVLTKQIGAVDALLHLDGAWWPRNFLSEGVHRAAINDVPKLNLTGAVFVLGTGWKARAVIGALARIGFTRFTISDKDGSNGESFIEGLKRVHFDTQMQFVPREMITQLPSIHSVAVNTLTTGEDAGLLSELIYFNYLGMGGLWLDLSLIPENSSIAEEADAAGAFVESPIKVATAVDAIWAEACVARPEFRFDRTAYRSLLSKSIRS